MERKERKKNESTNWITKKKVRKKRNELYGKRRKRDKKKIKQV